MSDISDSANVSFRDIYAAEDEVRCLLGNLGLLSEHVENLRKFNTKLRDYWVGTDADSYFAASDLDVSTLECLCAEVIGGGNGLCTVLKNYINDVLYSSSGGSTGE